MSLILLIDNNAKQDVWIDPSSLPTSALPGDLIAIRPTNIGKGKAKDKPLLYKVENNAGNGAVSPTETTRGRSTKAQVIVHPSVGASFGWVQARTPVELALISPIPPSQTASHLELFFSNVYLGRSDMFRISLSLISSPIYIGQRVLLPGTKARLRVGRVYNQLGHTVASGYVDEETKIIFRSESARCYVFIEISQEMWQFEEDGSMLREKLETFLSQLFTKWKGGERKKEGKDGRGWKGGKWNDTSHTVSIILYGRVVYDDNGEGEEERAPLSRSEDGLLFRDFYKVIIDQTLSPPPSIVRTVSSEIRKWQQEVLLRLRPTGEQKLAGRIAFAHESNVLEAINLTLNSFEEHWINRDLQRTGLSLIAITAGTSYYHVPKALLRLTTERMLCHGLGLDLISLSKTPLHTVPLFSFKSHEPGLSEEVNISNEAKRTKKDGMSTLSQKLAATSTPPSTTTRENLISEAIRIQPSFPSDQRDPLYYDSPSSLQESSIYYAEPLFIFCSFFGFQIDKPHRIDRFMPRARCYELFSQGIGERCPISIPFLPSENEWEEHENGSGRNEGNYLNEQEKKVARRERYDSEAVGAVTEGEVGMGLGWNRRSGATSGASGETDEVGSFGTDDSGGGKLRATEIKGAREREKAANKEKERLMSPPPPLRKERGRQDRVTSTTPGRLQHSPDRSKTPKGRTSARSPSVGAGSIRTVSGASIRSSAPKSSTPALIARLTTPGITNPSSTSNATAAVSKTGWLGLFRSGQNAPNAPAASTSVSRVEATANVKPEFDLDGNQFRRTSASSRGTSPSSSSRRSSSTAPQTMATTATTPSKREGPSQPISIGTKAPQTRGATDRIRGAKPTDSISAAKKTVVMKESWKGFGSKFNPSKPGKRSVGLADQRRRWASILIRHANDQRAVNWVSITRGACLPITTDYLPTADDLATQYSEYRYSVPTTHLATSFLLRIDNPGRSIILELITELLSQRLAQGFQICTPANAFGALDEIHLATSKTIPDVLRDVHSGEASAVYLSLSNQIHRIAYDRRTQSVVVKIMRRRTTWAKEDFSYAGLIWTQGSSNYERTEVDFGFPTIIEPADWQHLDRLVAGLDKVVESGLKSSLRYWRTRLVLLPAKSIPDRDYLVSTTGAFEGDATDDDIQAQGFLTLMAALQNLRYTIPGQEKGNTDVEFTTLSPEEWAMEKAKSTPAGSNPPATSDPPTQQRTSRWLRRATPFANARDESVASNTTNASNGSGGLAARERSVSPGGRSSDTQSQRPDSPPPPQPTPVSMTFSLLLDLDPKKESLRSEKLLVHLDKSHNSSSAYHIELNWLAISGKTIDGVVQGWIRTVGRYGLNLVETNMRGVGNGGNPFARVGRVKVKGGVPKDVCGGDQPADYYTHALLTSLSYFLDIGSDASFPSSISVRYSYRRSPNISSQYIHQSGTVLLSLSASPSPSPSDSTNEMEEVEFLYVPNRIFINHSEGGGGGRMEEAERVMRELKGVCEDEERLKGFWEEKREEARMRFGSGGKGAGAQGQMAEE